MELEIAKVQSTETMKREVIVWIRILAWSLVPDRDVGLVLPEGKTVQACHVPFGYLNVRFSMVPEKWFGVS